MTRDQLFKALENAGLEFDIGESFDGIQYISFLIDEEEFRTREDWEPKYCGDGQWAIFSKEEGDEWEDEQGDYRSFNSEAEATAYLDEFFKEKTA